MNIILINVFTGEGFVDKDFDPDELDSIITLYDEKTWKPSFWIPFGEPWDSDKDEDEWDEDDEDWEEDEWDEDDEDEDSEDDGVWYDDYEDEAAFWECNGI